MERPMQYAYEIYRQKSFSKAADALYISQPALSAIIRKLEESLETAVFDRSTKPVSLTPEGEYYIACAEKIMAVETEMQQYFEDIHALKKGSIRIGASSFFCSSTLPEILHAFRQEYPHITITIEENNSTPQLREMLLRKEIDFAMTSNTYPADDFEEIPLGEEAIILCVPKDNPLNSRMKDYQYSYEEILRMVHKDASTSALIRRAPLTAFSEESFITIDKISDLYPRILNMFRVYNITPKILMHLQQMSSCYYLAAGGFGSAFLRSSTLLTVRDTGNLCFYCIDSPLAKRPSRFYYKRGGYITKAMEAFMEWINKREAPL